MKIIKPLSLAAATALSVISLTSCGLDINSFIKNGNSVKETGRSETKVYLYDSSEISGLAVAAGVIVSYNVVDSATSTTVTIETDEAMMPHVVAELKESNLNIYRESDVSNSDIDIKVKVAGPSLPSWTANSGSQLSVDGAVTTSAGSKIDISSGAIAKFTSVKAPKLSIGASSGAIVKVEEFNGSKLSADASSGAVAAIYGIRGASVTAHASSGAAIKLYGWASDTDFDTSSGGSIDSSRLKLTR